MQVLEINVYPIKSLRGSKATAALVCRYGLEHDRQWMLVDAASNMITQRECPRLATLVPSVEPHRLRVTVPGSEDISVPLDARGWSDEHATVDIFGHEYVGAVAIDSVNRSFSEASGVECKLLWIRSDIFRTKTEVAFHDTSPIHVIGQASLDELNRRLTTPLPMNRFRPNLVIAGSKAFEEDTWERISIGATVLRAVKQCERCVIPTVDQAEGQFRGPEPLKTLATFRRKGQNVTFGAYYRPEQAGARIHAGDEVRVLEAGA